MGGILAYLVLAIPIFTHMYDNYTPTELAQLISNYSFKCQYLIYLFTRLYDILTEISVIAGNSMRIGELIDKMNDNIRISGQVFNKNLKLTQNLSDDTCLILTNVTITTPDKMKLLIKNVMKMTIHFLLNLPGLFFYRSHDHILYTAQRGYFYLKMKI
jgi:ATP-binding cassette subfamily D (ALD) protein 4